MSVLCLSAGAFASRARMAALSQGTDLTTRTGKGSLYLDDNRNIWRSAAALNDLGSHVTVEFGQDAVSGAGGTVEGGFFQSMDFGTIGMQLNNQNYGNVASNVADPGRLDVFFARNHYGVRVGYEKIDIDSVDTEGSGFDFGVGFDRGELSAWLNYVPSITNTVGGADTEADAAMNLGLTYEMSSYDLFAEYDQADDDNSSITLGAARVNEIDGGFHFQELSLNQTKAGDDSDMDLSVAFGIEHKAASWLTWRFSLRQSLLQTGDSETSTRDTQLGAGVSLTMGEMIVDGTVTNQSTGQLGTDNFMSNVSMTYMF